MVYRNIVFFFKLFILRESTQAGEGQREGERESQAGSALSVQSWTGTGLELTNHEIMTWAETKSWTLANRATQAGPILGYFENIDQIDTGMHSSKPWSQHIFMGCLVVVGSNLWGFFFVLFFIKEELFRAVVGSQQNWYTVRESLHTPLLTQPPLPSTSCSAALRLL